MTATFAPRYAGACAIGKLKGQRVSADMPERTEQSVDACSGMTVGDTPPAVISAVVSHNGTTAFAMPFSHGSNTSAEAPTRNRRFRAGTPHRNVPVLTSFSLTPGSERYALTCQWSQPLQKVRGEGFCEG